MPGEDLLQDRVESHKQRHNEDNVVKEGEADGNRLVLVRFLGDDAPVIVDRHYQKAND